MKTLAAVNIRTYERAVESLNSYKEVVDMGWQGLLMFGMPMSWKFQDNRAVCIIIGSDQGMCGQFNDVLVERVKEEVDVLEKRGLEVILWSAGERILGNLEDMGLGQGDNFSTPASLNSIHGKVQRIIEKIQSFRSSEGAERFYIGHNILAEGGGYQQAFHRVLPIDKSWAKPYMEAKWPNRCLPWLELTRKDMFSHLFQQHLYISFARAFAQSMASENAARLMAMQAAEKNILEMEDDLKAQFRDQRQAGITNEIFDIISGFEALSDESKL